MAKAWTKVRDTLCLSAAPFPSRYDAYDILNLGFLLRRPAALRRAAVAVARLRLLLRCGGAAAAAAAAAAAVLGGAMRVHRRFELGDVLLGLCLVLHDGARVFLVTAATPIPRRRGRGRGRGRG